MGNPIQLIAKALFFILEVMQYAIFINVLLSWVPQAKGTKFDSMLKVLTEPILGPIRMMINKFTGERGMMLDFSPIIAIIIINILESVVQRFVL